MLKNYLYIVLSAVCLATIGVLVKLIGSEVHYMSLNFYRVFFAFLFLLCTVPFLDNMAFHLNKQEAKEYSMIGFLAAIGFSTYNVANYFAPVSNIVIIDSLAPFVILVLAALLLKERITRMKMVVLAIAFLAMVIMNPFSIDSYIYGNILAFLSVLFYAVMVIQMRKENRRHGIGVVMWFFFFASLFLFPFYLFFGVGNFSAVWQYIILLGFISTGLGYLLYNLALEKVEASTSSIMMNVIYPLVAIFLAVTILQENITIRIILGGTLLIFAGVYLEMHDKKLQKELAKMSQNDLK